MIDLRVLSPDDWRVWRELRLLALTEAPDAFSATLAEWQGAADTEARWRARLETVPFNVVAFDDIGVPIGQVSGLPAEEHDCVELISMYVSPAARGAGAGAALVESVCSWAATAGATRVVLGVKGTNTPAIALYTRCGFERDAAAARGDCDVAMTRSLGASLAG